MKTATVRDLRNDFSRIEGWIREGEEVRIEKRGRPLAVLAPYRESPESGTIRNPDFAARRKAIWGDRVFSEEEVREMREAELEGEEG